jgi:predicted transcriptional regulator
MELRRLLSLLASALPGPRPSFQSFHVLEAILVIGREAPIGRKRLAEIVGLGEGAVRTLIQRLRAQSIVSVVGRGGCALSEKGEKLLRELERRMRDVGPVRLELPWSYPANYVLIVHDSAGRVSKGLEQRDEAVRAGVKALMVLTYQDGRLLMPGISDLSAERPEFASRLIKELGPVDGDVILISGGDSLAEARRGALAAAQTLL